MPPPSLPRITWVSFLAFFAILVAVIGTNDLKTEVKIIEIIEQERGAQRRDDSLSSDESRSPPSRPQQAVPPDDSAGRASSSPTPVDNDDDDDATTIIHDERVIDTPTTFSGRELYDRRETTPRATVRRHVGPMTEDWWAAW